MFETVLAFVSAYLPVVLTVLGALTVIAAAIAPFTKNTRDDKLVEALRWLQGKLSLLSLAQAATPKKMLPTVSTRNHRARK